MKKIISPLLNTIALPKGPYGPVEAAVVLVCRCFHGNITGLLRRAFTVSAELNAFVPRLFTHVPTAQIAIQNVPPPSCPSPSGSSSQREQLRSTTHDQSCLLLCFIHMFSLQTVSSVSGYFHSTFCSWDQRVLLRELSLIPLHRRMILCTVHSS